MHRFSILGILFATQVLVAFGWATTALGQSDALSPFEVPGTGHFIRFDDDSNGVGNPNTQLVDALIQWIVTFTGMPPPETTPKFRYMSQSAMNLRRAGNAGSAGGTFKPPALATEALYDRRSQTIIFAEGWQPSPMGFSVLVHELVHHLQAQAAYKYPCPAAAEDLSYEVQENWLRLFGKTLEESFEIDKLTLFVLTKCGI